jgi:hypothetical protein
MTPASAGGKEFRSGRGLPGEEAPLGCLNEGVPRLGLIRTHRRWMDDVPYAGFVGFIARCAGLFTPSTTTSTTSSSPLSCCHPNRVLSAWK